MPEPFLSGSTLALAWPKNSFYADKMNFLMQAMTEDGFFNERYDFWFEKSIGVSCAKSGETKASYSAFDMSLLIGILTLFGVFLAASAFVLLVEKLVWIPFANEIRDNNMSLQ